MDPRSAFDFSGQEVLVAGASLGGIGAAVAAAFQAAGAHVTITGIEPEPVPEDRGRYTYHRLDVTDAAAVTALAGRLDRLDILVNCAAITARGEEMAPDFFAHVVDVNLHGTFRLCHALHGHLRENGGKVINISSMYSLFGSPQNPAYGASKAAVAQLTRSLAIAWAGDGIRVNAVAPGFVVTEQSARSRRDAEHVARVNARTPMGRWAEPEDIAGPVLFLASPAAGFVTGASMTVDGGYSVV